MNISFLGYGERIVTFSADSSLTCAGVPVKVTDNGTVSPSGDGDDICGIAVSVSNGYASVQLGGYVSVPMSGTVNVGYQNLCAAAGGKVKADATKGRKLLVLDVTNGNVGFIL
ncbi:MAG: hypothetical protein Q8876_00175 [Bacillota bacterium]|nr:hypothetical protein [Bacillota bacterium]